MKDLGCERRKPTIRRPDPSALPQDDKVRTAQGFLRMRAIRHSIRAVCSRGKDCVFRIWGTSGEKIVPHGGQEGFAPPTYGRWPPNPRWYPQCAKRNCFRPKTGLGSSAVPSPLCPRCPLWQKGSCRLEICGNRRNLWMKIGCQVPGVGSQS